MPRLEFGRRDVTSVSVVRYTGLAPRCTVESISHSTVKALKMQENDESGSAAVRALDEGRGLIMKGSPNFALRADLGDEVRTAIAL